jgi:hypothetical protein
LQRFPSAQYFYAILYSKYNPERRAPIAKRESLFRRIRICFSQNWINITLYKKARRWRGPPPLSSNAIAKRELRSRFFDITTGNYRDAGKAG